MMHYNFTQTELIAKLQAAEKRIADLEHALQEAKSKVEIEKKEAEPDKVLRLSLALEAAGAGIWEWDLRTNKNVWSDELWQVYGLEPHSCEPSYDAWRNTIHPDDRQQAEQTVGRAAKNGAELKAEWRVVDADGSIRWLMSRGKPMLDAQGQVERFLGVVIDITERKQAEKMQRQWADAFQNCAHGIAIGDPATNQILTCNPAFAQLQGRSIEEITNTPILSAYAPADHALVRQAMAEADRAGRVRYEAHMARKDGSTYPVQMDVVSVRDEAGKLLYRVATQQDITERKQAENELRQSEENFSKAFMSSPAALLITRLADGRFMELNDAYSAIVGYDRSELIGRRTTDFNIYINPTDRQTIVEQLLASGSVRDFETSIRHRSGEIRHVVAAQELITFNGEQCIMSSLMDITARRLAEAALQTTFHRFQLILSSLYGGILVLTNAGRAEFANQAFCAMFDLDHSPEELLGLSAPEIIQKIANVYADPPAALARIQEIVTHRQPVRDEEIAMAGGRTYLRDFIPIVINGQQYGRLWHHLDLTERKRAEEELRVSEAKFKAVFENAPIGISLLDANRHVLESNETLEHIIRLSKPGLVAGAYLKRKYIREDGTEILTSELASTRALVENRPVRDIVNGIVLEDGQVMWAQVSAAPLDLPETRVVVITQDITERKQAEEKLRESEARYRSLFENMLNGFAYCRMLFDDQGQPQDFIYLAVNHAFETLTGLKDVVGKKVSQVIPGIREADSEVFRIYGRVALTAIPETFETYLESLQMWFFVSVYSPQPEYFVAVFDVITERKRAEEKLRESEMRFSKIFQASPVGINIFRLADNRSVEVNDAFLSLIGYTREEVVGHSAAELKLFVDPAAREVWMKVLRENKGVCNQEARVRRKNGEIINALASIDVIDLNSEPMGLVIITDISDLKRAEAKLHRTLEDLRRSNAELEQFAYVASHDLQEPLRAVAGMVQLLGQRYKGKLDDRADEYINHAVEASTRMQNLINDLLDYSRVDRMGKRFEPTAVEKSLRIALANLQVSIQDSQTQITHDPLPTVMADSGQLAHVLQNLIGNAIKFRGEAKPLIHVSAEQLAHEWRFSVRDNGLGIDPQYFERIFRVFQRLHTRREYPGTGIGLSLCKKIIERHGGRIWVESHVGQGATFYFTIPERPL